MPRTERLRIATELRLETPAGAPLITRDVTGEVTFDDDAVTTVVCTFGVEWADWLRVDHEHLFGLNPEVRGPIFAGGFREGVRVEIEARLDDASIPLASILGGDEFDVGALLYPSGPPEFRRTESWLAMFVKQADGPIKVGFRTRWADRLH